MSASRPTRKTAKSSHPRVPRYRAIAAELARRIEQGEYAPGALLPSESALAKAFEVSVMTIRQALAELAAQGLIERRHGHGTIVVPMRITRQNAWPYGLAEELRQRGLAPRSAVLEITETKGSPEARDALRLGPRATVVKIVRLRYAGDNLIGLQETVIPARYCPGLVDVDLSGLSLAHTLRERYGLAPTHALLTITAVEASSDLAAALDVRRDAALLRARRISYLSDDRPLEQTLGWFPGTRYSYELFQNIQAAPDESDGASPSDAMAG